MKSEHHVKKGLTVTVKDRENNRSTSFTVYSDDLEKVVKIIQDALKSAKE